MGLENQQKNKNKTRNKIKKKKKRKKIVVEQIKYSKFVFTACLD